VLQKITSISIEKSQYVTENLFQVMLTHVPVPTIPIPPPPPGAQAVIPAPPPPPPPGIVVGPPLPPPFPFQNRRRVNLEDVPLTINTIVGLLIPAVLNEWTKFFSVVDKCAISFPQLEKTFSNLKTKQVGREVEFLWKTGHGSSISVVPINDAWIHEKLELITNY